MSRKACSLDNAAGEGFFGRVKSELFYARDRLTTTIDNFIAEFDAYIRGADQDFARLAQPCEAS